MSRLLSFAASALASVALIAVIAAMPVAGEAGAQAAGTSDGTRCELKVGKRSGMTTLEGFVSATSTISGSYRISVTSAGGGGGSDVDQSGAFTAKSGQSVSLGVVSMGGTPGKYTADLTVTWNAGSIQCIEHVDGKI
jgi:hypothetical protein